MLDGVNDSDADARQLLRLLKGIPAFVNIIPVRALRTDSMQIIIPGSLYCDSYQRSNTEHSGARRGQYNPWPGSPYRCSSRRRISAFQVRRAAAAAPYDASGVFGTTLPEQKRLAVSMQAL